MESTNKPRVLFLAAECNPQWHSLPALVAEYFRALCEVATLTLVTHPRNRADLENWLPDNVEVHYIDSEAIAAPLYRFTSWLTGDPNKAMTLQVALSYPGSLYFEYRVWRQFRSALKAGHYDIVHRATPMSPTIPSPMAKWSPVPFVVGPVLGGLPWPEGYRDEMRREGEWMNYLRAAHRLAPYYRSTYRKAAAILAGYAHTMGDIPERDHDRVVEFSEGGIHLQDYPPEEKPENDRALVLFVGRLVPFKQPQLVVRAFIENPQLRRHRLVVVGDGPERPHLEALVNEHRLQDCVEIAGTRPIDEVRTLMRDADVFAFPSIREQGGGVITMASMARTPCVVVDYGGPARRVPEGCGIKLPLCDQASLTKKLGQALIRLTENRDEARHLGEAARTFTAKHYAWSWKAGKTAEIYEWVLGKRKEKPCFWEID